VQALAEKGEKERDGERERERERQRDSERQGDACGRDACCELAAACCTHWLLLPLGATSSKEASRQERDRDRQTDAFKESAWLQYY